MCGKQPEAEPLERVEAVAPTPLQPRAWGVEGPASTGQTGEPQDLRGPQVKYPEGSCLSSGEQSLLLLSRFSRVQLCATP